MNRNRFGDKNPNWRGGPIEKRCCYCGKSYLCPRFNINTSKYCSQTCKHLSLKGKPSWAKGKTNDINSPNYDPRISQGLRGAANPMYGMKGDLNPARRLGVRLKIGLANSGNKNGRWVNFEERKCICGSVFKVKKSSKQKLCSRKCIGINMRINNPMKNKEISKLVSEKLKNKYKTQTHPNKGNKRPDQKIRWLNNNPIFKLENKLKVFASRAVKPTKLEKNFNSFIETNNLPFNYTGDGKFFVTIANIKPTKVRNPDFTYKDVTQKKIVIEIGSNYHHPPENVVLMKSQYQQSGWACLYFEDKEFYKNSNNVKEVILNALGKS